MSTIRISCTINGEQMQKSRTSYMLIPVSQLIEKLSAVLPLLPGDVIFTGTPSGVITGYPKDKQVWLKPGDRVRTVISKLGELHFTLT